MFRIKIIKLLAVSAAICLPLGCNSSEKNSGGASLSTTSGMGRYLDNLPAVKSTEQWQNPYGKGIVINTAHYRIYTTLYEPLMLRQIPVLLESAYEQYASQIPEEIETKSRFDVYLFAEREQWESFTKDFVGSSAKMYLKITKGAYCANGSCVAYNIGRKTTFGVIAHEAWHQFNSKHFTYRLPSWLDEGIATTFETPIYEAGLFEFDPSINTMRLGGLRKTLLSGNFIPLRHLIALNPGYVIDNSETVTAFYSQAYALVRFLREENYGVRLRNYYNLLLAGYRGNWPLDERQKRIASDRNVPLTTAFNAYVSTRLFEIYITKDLEELEKEYLAFCNKIVYYIRLNQ